MSDRWSWDWLDEYEGFWEGGSQLQLELMSPFNTFDVIRDPSTETIVKGLYMPAIGYSGYRLATLAVGETMPSFWVRAAARYHDYKAVAQAASRTAPTMAVISAPVVTSVVGAVAYEKAVNEPIRKSHYGILGAWFGPFASGFGTVV